MAVKTVDRVYFADAISERVASKKPPEVKQPSPTNPSSNEAIDQKNAYIKEKMIEARMEGFSERAIVARKLTNDRKGSYSIYNWGIVVRVVDWASTIDLYKQLEIRWFAKNEPDSRHNIDEVYLVHQGACDEALEMIFDIQDEGSSTVAGGGLC